MGGGGGQSKPTPENRFASGALTGYLVGPQDLGDSKATEGAALFGQAGQGVGILPDYADLQAMAGQSYFGGLAGDNPNPILTDALGRAFTTPDIKVPSIGGGGAGFGGGGGGFNYTPTGYGAQLLTPEDVTTAKNYLMNTPSVFDQMSGGPIVDEINQRVNAASDAYTNRQMNNLSRATEISLANDMAQGGLISSSTVMNHREDLAQKVLDDIAVFDATANLDATKYLGDLAMQDIMNQSNNMQSILTAALTEKNINAGYDAQMAATKAQYQAAIMTANISAQAQMAVASLNSQTQLAMNQQDNALQLLGMGQTDFQNTKTNQLNIGTLPLQLLAGQGGKGSIENTLKSP